MGAERVALGAAYAGLAVLAAGDDAGLNVGALRVGGVWPVVSGCGDDCGGVLVGASAGGDGSGCYVDEWSVGDFGEGGFDAGFLPVWSQCVDEVGEAGGPLARDCLGSDGHRVAPRIASTRTRALGRRRCM